MPAILEHKPSFGQTQRFVTQLRRDPALRQQLLGTRSLFDVMLRSHWRKGSSWQRLLWRGVFPVLVVVSMLLSLVPGQPF